MGTAVIGLVGAFVGTATTLIGSRVQQRQEHRRWERDRKREQYEGALRYVLRAANRRSAIEVHGGRANPVLDEDGVRAWFDDLVEAQFLVRSLTTVCGAEYVDRLKYAADRIDRAIEVMNTGASSVAHPKQGIINSLRAVVETITDCAREDIGSLESHSQTSVGRRALLRLGIGKTPQHP